MALQEPPHRAVVKVGRVLVTEQRGLALDVDVLEIVDLEQEDAPHGIQNLPHHVQEGRWIEQVIERVQEHQKLGLGEIGRNQAERLHGEQRIDDRNPVLLRHLREVLGRLESERARAPFLEQRQQVAVGGADVDDLVARPQAEAVLAMLDQRLHVRADERRVGRHVLVRVVVLDEVHIVLGLNAGACALQKYRSIGYENSLPLDSRVTTSSKNGMASKWRI